MWPVTETHGPIPPDVTVAIPTRDRAALLAETLRSVREQTIPCAVIVADDGSTDATDAVAARFDASLLRNPSGGWGAAGARNAALATVETPYVAFLDSDDLLLPGALAALRAALAAAPTAPFAYGCALAAARHPEGWRSEGLIAPLRSDRDATLCRMFARNPVPSSGVLLRTDTLRAAGGYDTGLVFSEDHELWLRLAQRAAPVHVPDLVLIHRRHPANRHDAGSARRDDGTITRMAEQDPRLRPCLPDRLGVQLCEAGLDAIRGRRPAALAAACLDLVVRRRRRVRIARAGVRHFRLRRQAGAVGRALLHEDAGLRDWLAAYS